jgi:LacI family transcriptional regulator
MILRKTAGHRRNILLVFETRFSEARALLRGISKYVCTHGDWAVFLDDEAHAEKVPGALERKPWDGVISLHTTRRFAAECRRLKIPLVDLNDRSAIGGVHQIRPDNEAIGRLGAAHFIERGYRNFGFCGYGGQEWSVERRRGFVEVLERAGFPCDLHEPPVEPGSNMPDWERDLIPLTASWLRGRRLPLAVMVCHDVLGVHVIRACQHAGLSVPEEAAVLGAEDDGVRCELVHPPLSSVVTNRFVLGYAAGELLDKLMSGAKVTPAVVRIGPTRVEVRQSSDILAIEDKIVASALGYIRDNACSGITVADVAGHVAVSRSQMERKFRRYIGRSPQAEIRQVRIDKAKQLLLETDFPLKKIAELVGFDHTEYLSVFFKRGTSRSPGAYRRQIRIETDQRAPKPGLPAGLSPNNGSGKQSHFFEGRSHSPVSSELL